VHHDKILILDFGSQVTQLIARRIREAHVYCEVHPCDVSNGWLQAQAGKMRGDGEGRVNVILDNLRLTLRAQAVNSSIEEDHFTVKIVESSDPKVAFGANMTNSGVGAIDAFDTGCNWGGDVDRGRAGRGGERLSQSLAS